MFTIFLQIPINGILNFYIFFIHVLQDFSFSPIICLVASYL